MRVDQAFDEMARDYDERIRRYVPHYERLVQHAADLPATVVKRVVDLGSGTGAVISSLLSQSDELYITAVDASSDMVELLERRFADHHIDYHRSWFQDLDLATRSYDLATACMSIHHLDTQEKADIYAKLYDALAPGGRLQLSDLMIDKTDRGHASFLELWQQTVMQQGGSPQDWREIMEHYDAYDRPDDLSTHETLLHAAGFSRVEVTFQRGYWISLRAHKD